MVEPLLRSSILQQMVIARIVPSSAACSITYIYIHHHNTYGVVNMYVVESRSAGVLRVLLRYLRAAAGCSVKAERQQESQFDNAGCRFRN